MSHTVSLSHSSSRAPATGARLLLFLLVALLGAACGREATPRAAARGTPAGAGPPTSVPSTTRGAPSALSESALVAGDPRAQGDPSAPITVIEYADYQ